jgi:hypothetical protein
MWNRAPQEVPRWNEVGVEDGDELTARRDEAVAERACLESDGSETPPVRDIHTEVLQLCDFVRNERAGNVRGVVQHFYLEAFAGIVEVCDGVDNSESRIVLVANREMDGDLRPLRGRQR